MVTYPKDWKECRINELLAEKPQNGLTKPKAVRGSGVKMVGMGELFAQPHITNVDMARVPVTKSEMKNYELKMNDLLFARQSLVLEGAGKCSIIADIKEPTVFESHLIRARIDEDKADANFIFYWFNHTQGRNAILSLISRVAAAGVRSSELVKIRITLPSSVYEQKAIAATLSSFDTHIDNLTALIEKKKAIRDGVLSDLMSGRTRLAGFNGEWETKTIGCCVDIYQGGTPLTYRDDYWGGDIVWITPGEITKLKSLYIGDSERKITDRGLENSSAVLLPVGAILLCTRATIGDLAISSCLVTTNQGFKNLICRDDTDNVFFAYLLKKYKDVMIERAKGTTFLELSKTSLSNIFVALPPLAEQKAIADILTSMDTEIQNLEAERDKMQAIREGAIEDLLTGRVRLPL